MTWTRLETWVDDPSVMGDECVSPVYVTLYGNGAERFTVSYYVDQMEDGTYGVSEQDKHWEIEMHGDYDAGQDIADITYPDGPSVLVYQDIESAEAVCKRAAERDDSGYFA